MAEVVARKKSTRVERRGRFTITDIEPDSPMSSGVEDPQDAADQDDSGDDENRRSFAQDSAAAAALIASERISPFGSAVFERGNGVVRVVDSSGLTSSDGFSTSMVSETAVSDTVEDGRSTTRPQPDLKVERKGRFTIIELASDTPQDKDTAEEQFSTTTSISVTSAQVSQANALNLSCSPSSSNPLFSPPNDRIPSSPAVLARAVSEIVPPLNRRPSRSIAYSSDGLENGQHDQSLRVVSPIQRGNDMSAPFSLSSSFGTASARPPPHEPLAASPVLKPAPAPSLSSSALNPLSSSSTSVNGTTIKEKPVHEIGANRRHLASRQKAITISAEQFIQQQQTIASLIRQQQELKQLIAVLQEQQQHLMDVPLHLTEFKLDQAHSEAQKDSMRDVQIQVTTLSRANDALQDLLSQAEHDAHERTMEIECLSDENNELRHRNLIMERKFNEERKRSYTLEQELNRTKRALQAARQKGEQQQQQQFLRKYQHKLLSRPTESAEPVDNRLHPAA